MEIHTQLAVLALTLVAQEPAHDTAGFVREHRAAHAALEAGELDEARASLRRCLELSPENATIAYGQACVAARAGDAEQALDALARAADQGYADAAVAEWDPDLESLRPAPRFAEIVGRMRAAGAERGVQRELYRISDMLATPGYTDAAISKDGARIAVTRTDGLVRVLDSRDGDELARTGPLGSAAWAAAFDPLGPRVAVLTWDGAAHLWDYETGALELLDALPADPEGRDFGWPFGARVEFDPTGARLLVAAYTRGATLWSADGALVRRIEPSIGRHASVIADWSHDGARLYFVRAGVVHVLDARTGAPAAEPLTELSEDGMTVTALVLHPDGECLATGHEDGDDKGWLRVWDLESRTLLWEQDAQRWDPEYQGFLIGAVGEVRFSPSGELLAASSRSSGLTAVFDIETGERRWCSEDLGGRRGTMSDLRWSTRGDRLWYSFAAGVLELGAIEGEIGARPPAVSPSALAVQVGWSGVALGDANTGQVRWARPSLGRPGWIVQAGTGHFDGDADPVGLELHLGARSSTNLGLGALVERLHDPKRVRAAMAGVGLVKPELD